MKKPLETAVNLLLGASIIFGLITCVLRMTCASINFDEHVHLHYLWLISQNLVPFHDFFCHYPPFFYYLFQPVFLWLPHNPHIFVASRFFPLACILILAGLFGKYSKEITGNYLAGALAVIVFAISPSITTYYEFRPDLFAYLLGASSILCLLPPPTPLRVFTATFLAGVSLLIMPKHALLLLCSFAGYCFYIWKHQKTEIRRLLAGAGLAAVVVLAIPFLWNPHTLFDTVFATVFNLLQQRELFFKPDGLLDAFIDFGKKDAFLALLFIACCVNFSVHLKKAPVQRCYVLGGLLISFLLMLISTRCGYLQYVLPLTVFAAFFMPYLFTGRYGAIVLTCLALSALPYSIYRLYGLKNDLYNQPLFKEVVLQKTLQDLIPENEFVVSSPFTHPIFRRDPGFVYYDGAPSYRNYIGKKYERYFTKQYFLQRLQETRPAYFCLFTTFDNQPPEYYLACQEYMLARDTPDYVKLTIPNVNHSALDNNKLPIWVRKDLVNASQQVP